MALEIEFEDDEHPDAAWLADDAGSDAPGSEAATSEGSRAQETRAEESGTEEAGTTRPRVGALLTAPFPLSSGLLLQLGVLLTTFAVGASSVAGYQLGRAAPGNRSIVALHLAGGRTYQLGPAPAPRNAAWSDTAERSVSLTVVNDGPDPVTVVGGTASGPLVHADFALPAGGLDLAAGATATLHAAARVDCRPVFEPLFMTVDDPSSLDTVADFGVRTLDGRAHRTRLTVDPASATAVSGVCTLLGPPVGLAGTDFSGLTGSDSYTVTYHATSAAPFPLSVSTLQDSVNQWSFSGGLTARLADPAATLPAHGSANLVVDVTVTNCAAATQANDDEFGFFPLVFAEADGAAKHEEFAQPMPLVSRSAIGQACRGR
jgi:hypothetical protein